VVVLRGDSGWRGRARGIVLSATVAFAAFGLVPVGASAARHYEKVSPAEKGLGDIVGDGATTVASRFGDAVAFNSRTPFGDTVGSGTIGQTQYVARRTDEAWEVRAITPTPRPDARQTFFAPTLLQIYSEDLRSAVVRAYDLPGVTGDMPLRNNIYVEDTATRALETVTVSQVDAPTIPDFLQYPQFYWPISADARHVAFVTSTQFLPDAVPGVPNVYQWDDGVLSVASVLPDGTVAANGADTPLNLRGAMSADGSRLLITASTGGNTQLYLRVDGSSTAWVSETELDPSDPSYQPDPSGVRVMGMTPDGRHVFFMTDTPLVAGDANGGPDLYRYTDSDDPSSESNLTMISPDGDLGGAELVGMSDDGELVYYQTPAPRLVVWDHGTTRVINDGAPINGEEIRLVTSPGTPGYGRVTPDGMWLALATNASVDAAGHGLTGEVTNGHREMYLYSLRENRLVCVSCPPGPATSDITVLPEATQSELTLGNAGFRPRYLSESGQVFFSTADALVAHDTNSVLDAYEYDPATGAVSLLSTGTGNDPTTFADASASGDDVFIVTRQRLVSSDRDDFVDLYDVRHGSSLPEEQPTQPECQGDGCQPPPSGSPPDHPGGSSIFDGQDMDAGAPRVFAVRQRIRFRGASGLLPVRLFAAGRLAWSGRGLRAGAIRRSRAGSYEVRLSLKRGARAQLRATGIYTTSVRLTFVSADGDGVERTTRVTFRVAAKKGR
jgi:hypothetical protein